MCNKLDNPKETIKDAKAYWKKESDKGENWFVVEARQCNCGEQWWCRTQNGYWVECYPEQPLSEL